MRCVAVVLLLFTIDHTVSLSSAKEVFGESAGALETQAEEGLGALSSSQVGLSQLSPQRRFTHANHLFDQANTQALTQPASAQLLYREAALHYQYLIDHENPRSTSVHTNLGNAYFFSGDHGRAVLNYQRALMMDPMLDDVQHNLAYVRTLTVDSLPQTRSQRIIHALVFWHRWSFSTRAGLLLSAHVLFWMILARRKFQKDGWLAAKPWLKVSTWLLAAFSLTMAISLGISLRGWDNPVQGVVVEREVLARQGDGYIYDQAFTSPLHSGTEFSLIEQKEEWIHVRLLDGSNCWLPLQSVELIQ